MKFRSTQNSQSINSIAKGIVMLGNTRKHAFDIAKFIVKSEHRKASEFNNFKM